MRTTRATRVCVGDAPCTRAPTRTRAPRRTRCAATPRPLCLPPRPLPTTHPRKHPVHTKPSPCTAFLPTTPRMALARRRAGAHARPCRACARRALARCPLRLPPPIANPPRPRSHQTPTRGLLPPAPGPRSASRRRPPLPMPCPCARRPLARCTLARRPCPRAAPRRRAVTARFTACCGPAPPARCPPCPRTAMRRRPVPAPLWPCLPPAVRRPLARCTLARRPCPRTALRRRLVPVPACHAQARRPPDALPAFPESPWAPPSRGKARHPRMDGQPPNRGATPAPTPTCTRLLTLPCWPPRRSPMPCSPSARPCHRCPASRASSPCRSPA